MASTAILVNFEGLKIRVPHPAAYALHKFIIFKRRAQIDKHDRDIGGALRVFHALIKNSEHATIQRIFRQMHKKWQATIIKNLQSIGESEIIEIIKSA